MAWDGRRREGRGRERGFCATSGHARWIHRIRNGQITVDGQVVTDPDMILRVLSWYIIASHGRSHLHQHLLQVLYEDDDMVALNKPSGLQVLPKGIFQQHTVLAQLQWKEWKMPPSSCSKRKNVQLHPVPVHRLGRGTSGLLLCAKTKLAKVQLASYFAEGAANAEKKRDETEVGKERKISKFYRALVTGILEHDEDVVTQPIGLVHYPGVAEGLYVACSSGKPAMSKVCVLERLAHQNQTLVQVEIHSGRPHQMRIHLAYIGYPLVEVMRGLYSLFPETVGITCMLIGWSFLIQPRIRFTDQQTIMTEHQVCVSLTFLWLAMQMLKITAPLPHILQTREERCDPQVDT
ncbi:hypothetical protein VPH35_022772 [Triticum aestivum]